MENQENIDSKQNDTELIKALRDEYEKKLQEQHDELVKKHEDEIKKQEQKHIEQMKALLLGRTEQRDYQPQEDEKTYEERMVEKITKKFTR